MKYEVGKTYTLTGDEKHWTYVPIREKYGDLDFPLKVEFSGLDSNYPEFRTSDGAVLVLSGEDNLCTEPEMVNHPPHYNGHPKGIEAIDVIEDNPFMNLGNAMKYLWRVSWGSKGHDDEDLAKAIWYIERERSRRAKEN